MLGAVNGTHLTLLADLHSRTCYVSLAYVRILRPLKPIKEIGSQCLVKIHLQARDDCRKYHLRVTEAGGTQSGVHIQGVTKIDALWRGGVKNVLFELFQDLCDSGTPGERDQLRG